jgi:hypothetical protein
MPTKARGHSPHGGIDAETLKPPAVANAKGRTVRRRDMSSDATVADVREPSWQPDPTGRFDYRWFDGVEFTEHVSTNGTEQIDAVALPAPRPALRTWLFGGVGVVALAVLLWVIVGRESDANGGRYGAFDDQLSDQRPVFTRTFSLKAGEAIRVRIEPGNQRDIALHIFTIESTALDIATRTLELSPGGDATDPEQYVAETFETGATVVPDDATVADLVSVHAVDDGEAGDHEATYFVALADGNYSVGAVALRLPRGRVRMVIEKWDDRIDLDVEPGRLDDVVTEEFFVSDDFYDDDQPFKVPVTGS